MIGIATLGYSQIGTTAVIAVAAGILFVYFAAWRAETFPLLFLVYVSLFPIGIYAAQFGVFPVPFHPKAIPLFMALSFIILFLHKELDPRRLVAERHPKDAVGKFVALFLIWASATILFGISQGHKPFALESEVQMYLLFFSFFLWRSIFRWKGQIENWLIIFAIIGVLTALEYITLVAYVFQDIITFVLFRNVTRQSQVIIGALPIVLSLFLIYRSKWVRVGAAISVLLFVVQVFLTQQRIIWLSFVLMTYIYITLYLFRKGIKKSSLVRWMLVSFLLLALLLGLLLLAAWVFNTDIDVLLSRWEKVQSLTDESFMMRVYDSRHLIELVGNKWLTGLGGGMELQIIPSSMYFHFIDVSYLTAYLKGGIPFALLLVLVYLGGIYRAFQVYRRTAGTSTQYYAIAIITALSGQMMAGITTVSMIYYRFIFIWMMLIAAAVVLYERVKRQQSEEATVDA
ncbi:hypothetical protein KQI63_02290 [bacterium]|nr:hypothetical protein [bacterium]